MTTTAEGRRSEILNVLRFERYLKVVDLSQRFGVSQMSIRRDLCQLEEQGILRRVHGGMVATPLLRLGIEINPEVVSQLQNHSNENEAIAQAAAALVQPGDHLIFDSGILSYLTACALPGDLLTQGDLTVITNSLLVALELAPWPGIEMIMLGGEYQADRMMKLTGPHTLRSLEGLHADKMFLTVEAIDIAHGVTISMNGDERLLAKRMIAACNCVVLLALGCKIGGVERHQILTPGEFQTLVTDQECPAKFVSHLRNQGANVIRVQPIQRKTLCP